MSGPSRRRAVRSALTSAAALAVVGALTGCVPAAPAAHRGGGSVQPAQARSAPAVPRPAHVVLVIEENRAAGRVDDRSFFRRMASEGASFSDYHAVTHPSEPNYLALWSGSTQGVTRDPCPLDLGSVPSFGSQLIDAGRSVAIYSEDLPQAGYTGCSAGWYVHRHNPLAAFSATSGPDHNLPFSAFPSDYAKLPDVAVVVPNLQHDMHNGSVGAGNRWLEQHLTAYAEWARTHDSLLVVTFDEDDHSEGNRVFTAIVGQQVKQGVVSEPADHYRLLHTLEAAFGLPQLGRPAAPVTDIWR